MELPGLLVFPTEELGFVGGVVGIDVNGNAVIFLDEVDAIDGWVDDYGYVIGCVLFTAGGCDIEAVGFCCVEGGEVGAVEAVTDFAQWEGAVVAALDGDGGAGFGCGGCRVTEFVGNLVLFIADQPVQPCAMNSSPACPVYNPVLLIAHPPVQI